MSEAPVAERAIGFFTLDIAGLDKDDRSRIELFPGPGTYVHPISGKFEITTAHLEAWAADINGREPETLSVDFDHGQAGTAAAGWFVPGTASIDEGKLLADVDWTPEGAAAIREKKYRFISPEFSFKFRDQAGKIVNKARLWAAALTNRPFFDQMQPVTLCSLGLKELLSPTAHLVSTADYELLARVTDEPQRELLFRSLQSFDEATRASTLEYLASLTDEPKEDDVDRKTLAAALGLNDDATEDEILAAAKVAAEKAAKPPRKPANQGDNMHIADVREALGLADDADEAAVLAAASKAREASERQGSLEDEVETLRADAARTKTTEARLKVIEAERRAEKVKRVLEDGVRGGKVIPGEKAELAKHFASNPEGLIELIASRPDNVFRQVAFGGDGGELSEALAPVAKEFASAEADGIDEEGAKMHVRATQILREQNIRKPTEAQYADALEQAYEGVR